MFLYCRIDVYMAPAVNHGKNAILHFTERKMSSQSDRRSQCAQFYSQVYITWGVIICGKQYNSYDHLDMDLT